jgi:hypothetical protein
MNKKEIAIKLLDSLKMLETISNYVYLDYSEESPYNMIISVNGLDKTVSKYNSSSVSEILFYELQKTFNVSEPVCVFDKAREPIYHVLNDLLGNDAEIDEDEYYDLNYLEQMIKEL